MRFKRPSPHFEIPAFGFVFVLLCYGFVRINFFSDMKPLPAWLAIGLVLVILFAVFLSPLFMVGLAVWRCFGQGSRLELIRLVAISYGTLIFVFAGIYLVMASAGDHDDDDAERDEGEAGRVGERSAMRGDYPLRRRWRRIFQKQIKSLYHKAEGHDRDGGAHPGEKRTFVGGVVAVTLDHWTAPMLCRCAL